MDKPVQFGHARNNYPAPPVTVEVEGGIIKSFTIEREAIDKYTSSELSGLFEAAGIGPIRISIPIPASFMNQPLLAMRFRLKPGKYWVSHRNDSIWLPESAFDYSLQS